MIYNQLTPYILHQPIVLHGIINRNALQLLCNNIHPTKPIRYQHHNCQKLQSEWLKPRFHKIFIICLLLNRKQQQKLITCCCQYHIRNQRT